MLGCMNTNDDTNLIQKDDPKPEKYFTKQVHHIVVIVVSVLSIAGFIRLKFEQLRPLGNKQCGESPATCIRCYRKRKI